jgi:hypothetical protein
MKLFSIDSNEDTGLGEVRNSDNGRSDDSRPVPKLSRNGLKGTDGIFRPVEGNVGNEFSAGIRFHHAKASMFGKDIQYRSHSGSSLMLDIVVC